MTTVDIYKSKFVSAVAPRFNSGVKSLGDYLRILQYLVAASSRNSMSNIKSVKKELLENIQRAYSCFENAKHIAIQQKTVVDNELERLVFIEAGYKDELATLETKARQYKSMIGPKETQVQEAEEHCQYARDQIQSANNDISDAENEHEEGEEKVSKAILWGLLPVVGTVIGIIQAVDGIDQIRKADSKLKHAKCELKKNESKLKERNNELYTLRSELQYIKSMRGSKRLEIKNLNNQIVQLKTRQKQIATALKNIAKCTNFISAILGKTRVLAGETLDAYSLEPLVDTMNDIGLHLNSVSSSLGFNCNNSLDLVTRRLQMLSEKVSEGSLEYDSYNPGYRARSNPFFLRTASCKILALLIVCVGSVLFLYVY